MGKKFVVTCQERFMNGKTARTYYPGDRDEIDPLSPEAKYFDGWPPGTEVYTKSKGKAGTRIIPGLVEKKEEETVEMKPVIEAESNDPIPKSKKGKGNKVT